MNFLVFLENNCFFFIKRKEGEKVFIKKRKGCKVMATGGIGGKRKSLGIFFLMTVYCIYDVYVSIPVLKFSCADVVAPFFRWTHMLMYHPITKKLGILASDYYYIGKIMHRISHGLFGNEKCERETKF